MKGEGALNKALFFSVMVLVIFVLFPHSRADDNSVQESSIDFTMLSLEELKNVEIISVSKKPEKISQAAAAVFVITQEDIRRAGITSIPDALRLVPGVQVAQTNTRGWAISVRGFNDTYSNKLLVMIDGRSVYTPIYSGVFWDEQDTILEDIERIEVIRGPGSALWGSNAVNGVINIITKNADKTIGGLVSAGGPDHNYMNIRYGDVLGNDIYYRIYGKYSCIDQLDDSIRDWKKKHYIMEEDLPTDNWREFRGGFRTDWKSGTTDSFTLQGEAHAIEDDMEMEVHIKDEDEDDVEIDTYKTTKEKSDSRIEGVHLLGRWHHTFSETSDSVLQIYSDHTERDSMLTKFAIDTFDLDFQHRFALGMRHEITWGVGYRFISDKLESFNFMIFEPERYDQNIFSGFVQDEVQFSEDRLYLTIGSKFEHNGFTGLEIQPNIRLLWTPREHHSVWGAVSRAVRVPSRSERNGAIVSEFGNFQPSDTPALKSALKSENDFSGNRSSNIIEIGTDSFDSEDVVAFEIGYRFRPAQKLWLDLAAFYNRYHKLQTSECSASRTIPAEWERLLGKMEQEWAFEYTDNNMDGETYGVEASADWQMTGQWNFRLAYSYLQMCMHLTDSTDTKSISLTENTSPRHQFSMRSSLDITKQIEFDIWLRYVGELPAKPADSYTALGARLAWKPFKNLEFSVTGNNLTDRLHSEFSVIEVERSIYGKVTWRF
ncbi:MAG: TonB-dependent receptor [Desulfobacterales bacterium]|nr:TonB-dependent receptor [Desulfobacterales bacterium]